MSTRLRSLLALLPALALLAVPGAALAAKTKTKTTVEPAQTTAELTVHGTDGWLVRITGDIFGARFGGHSVGIVARMRLN